jgi:hypothetical protein
MTITPPSAHLARCRIPERSIGTSFERSDAVGTTSGAIITHNAGAITPGR